MLSRFCTSAPKIVRWTHIVNINKCHSIPALILSQQKCHYVTAGAAAKLNNSNSLKSVVNQLKTRVTKKSRLSNSEFNSLLAKLKSEKANSYQALDILEICSSAERNQNDIVNSIWNELKRESADFQIQHYNYLLKFARNEENVERAQAIFDELLNNGITPDAISYQYLLTAYCEKGNIEKAIEVLEMMEKDKLGINEVSFNKLVECHIISGNIEAAMDTLKSLKDNGYKVKLYTLKTLLSHNAKTGDMENMQKTFEMLEEENLELLNRDIFKVMCDLAVNGHEDKICSLTPKLKPKEGMKKSLSSSITMFVENKQSSIVPKILQTIDVDVKVGYKHLIQEMVRLSSSEQEFDETFKSIEAAGITVADNFDIFKPILESLSEGIVRKLLAHMKSYSVEAIESVFEKLFRLSAEKGVNQILEIVDLMCIDYRIQPRIKFVRDVILPCLNAKENPAYTVSKLQTTKISIRSVIVAIINDSLNRNDFKTAYEFATTNPGFYGIDLVKLPLVKAFANTTDILTFVSFVRVINDSFAHINDYVHENQFSPEEIQQKQIEFNGDILSLAIMKHRFNTNHVTQLLEEFVNVGLSIGPSQAATIQTNLKVHNFTKIGTLLQTLSQETLTLKPVAEAKTVDTVNYQFSSTEVENMLKDKLEQGHNIAATQKLLFLAYIREENIRGIEELMANGTFSITGANYSTLIKLYTNGGNLNSALDMLKRARAKNTTYKMSSNRTAKLVALMFEKRRDFREIKNILRDHRQDKPELHHSSFEHLMDGLAANSKPKLVEQLFDALIEYKYIKPTVKSTGPLVTVYLNNGLYAEAVEKFEYLANTYKFAVVTMILFNHLIRNKEVALLERAFDIFKRIHGDSNAHCRLAFAFVECEKDDQAKAIFQRGRIKHFSTNISRECKQFVKYGRAQAVKTLLKATKGIECDRHEIYQALLDIYYKQNKAQEAINLWNEYSTEGISTKHTFKIKLAKLLEANSIDILFKLT